MLQNFGRSRGPARPGPLTSWLGSRHRPTTAPPLPGSFTADPNCETQQNGQNRLVFWTRLQTFSSTDLLGDPDHLKVPRPETLVGVDGSEGEIHAGGEGVLEGEAGTLPAQLEVLVHQAGQGGPVPVLQGDPEGGTGQFHSSELHGSFQTNLAPSASSANVLIASTTRGSPVETQV